MINSHVSPPDQRSLLDALLGDGRFLLALTGAALVMSGGFAILQSISGHFLPHDAHALGMDAATLAHVGNRHLVHFMFHDRVAFGGTLLTVGVASGWLAEFPLRTGVAWAWWTYGVSGLAGFVSFLAYLGYGYLDSWHAVATVFLLAAFLAGWWRARRQLANPIRMAQLWQRERCASAPPDPPSACIGRGLLLACAAGLVLAGGTILVVGMTRVFVPQDLAFIGLDRAQIGALSPTLIPVIAHDRAGFGGGILSTGILVGLITWHARLTRSFVQIMALMGTLGFGAALGVHVAIGYLDSIHLAPAYAGGVMFLAGVVACGIGEKQARGTRRLKKAGGRASASIFAAKPAASTHAR